MESAPKLEMLKIEPRGGVRAAPDGGPICPYARPAGTEADSPEDPESDAGEAMRVKFGMGQHASAGLPLK